MVYVFASFYSAMSCVPKKAICSDNETRWTGIKSYRLAGAVDAAQAPELIRGLRRPNGIPCPDLMLLDLNTYPDYMRRMCWRILAAAILRRDSRDLMGLLRAWLRIGPAWSCWASPTISRSPSDLDAFMALGDISVRDGHSIAFSQRGVPGSVSISPSAAVALAGVPRDTCKHVL
ncbi:MAG: hypothetical protein JWN34_4239 [Bryobacterales bacterium]|nr:hypothetical protein [Bryobacterales bacterium]